MGLELNISSGGQAIVQSDGVSRLGAGQQLLSATDYDNILFPGMYRIDNNATNAPTTSFHAVVVFGNAGNVTTQIAVKLQSTEVYVRSFNTAFTSWDRIDT